MSDPHFDVYMGHGPNKLLHWEHWSCPDAETYLTGIDYYEHPRECRLKLQELYPQLGLGVPETDEPKPRPSLSDGDGPSADHASHTVRWGDGNTGTFLHGEAYFRSAEEVFAFSPLAKGDFTDWGHVVMAWDYSDEEKLYQMLRAGYPAEWGDKAPEGSAASSGFYNSMFMWPMLTFGWELFLECCLDPRFEPVMGEFLEINRRVFRSFARLPINFVVCHDDIVTTRGLVCSPAWMRKYIYSAYEELWGILGEQGIRVVFMTDGNPTDAVDDVMACGALGIVSEPFADYKAIARKYDNPFLAGEGDNRVLQRNAPAEIEAMVRSMVETAKLAGEYMMCIGNHIPWNVPPPAIKLYLDLSAELGYR